MPSRSAMSASDSLQVTGLVDEIDDVAGDDQSRPLERRAGLRRQHFGERRFGGGKAVEIGVLALAAGGRRAPVGGVAGDVVRPGLGTAVDVERRVGGAFATARQPADQVR